MSNRRTLIGTAPTGTYTNYVIHGATAGTSRPASSGPVTWVGSVTPTNAVAGDFWEDTSTTPYTLRVRGASSFSAIGAGVSAAQAIGYAIVFGGI